MNPRFDAATRERIQKLMRRGVMETPPVKRPFFTGYAYSTQYDWDQYFEAIVQLYMGWDTTYIQNAVLNFLDYQEPSGFIRRCINTDFGQYSEEEYQEMVKPFLAQMLLLCHQKDGHLDWVDESVYQGLRAYLNYWIDDCDHDKNGLSVWNSSMHSGMDNQHERAGKWRAYFCEGIDLNCYLYRECLAMERIAPLCKHPDDAGLYRQWAEAKKNAIQGLWSGEAACYLDRDERDGTPVPAKTVAMFLPLWAGIATAEQAECLVKRYLTNPDEFWRPYPLPAMPASEPGYSPVSLEGDIGCCWRANTWIPTNYMVMHGLMDYGYGDVAAELARKTFQLVEKAGDREYYTSDDGNGCGLDPFWGWSLLAYFMEDEVGENRNPMSI